MRCRCVVFASESFAHLRQMLRRYKPIHQTTDTTDSQLKRRSSKKATDRQQVRTIPAACTDLLQKEFTPTAIPTTRFTIHHRIHSPLNKEIPTRIQSTEFGGLHE